MWCQRDMLTIVAPGSHNLTLLEGVPASVADRKSSWHVSKETSCVEHGAIISQPGSELAG